MSIKNTDFVYGLVVFTGHETKVMKNSGEAKYKLSRLEIAANGTIVVIFVIQILLAFIFGLLSYFVRKGIWDYSDTDVCTEESTAACASVTDAVKLAVCMAE